MPTIQAFLAALSLLVCVGLAADQPSLPALFRGALSNFVLVWLLFAIAERLGSRWLRWCCLGLIATLLSATEAHLLINGAYPAVSHAELAIDDSFLAALIGDGVFGGLLALNLAWIGALEVVRGRLRPFQAPSRLLTALLPVFSVFLVATALFTPGISAHWYARNLLEHQFWWDAKLPESGAAVVDGRTLVPASEGAPLQALRVPKHVVLVLIEGLSAEIAASGATPEIRDLEREGLVVRRFVAHQRQTHRGLFALLCGAYPNLLTPEAKSHLVALSGLQQRCLPAELRDAGFRTAFLQSADLGYMTKDLFAQAVGFTVVKGQHELASGGADGPWGLDDRTLFRHALDDLNAHADQRTFTTLLTSGTHPPYRTPVSSNDKARAFAFASDSVAWFVEQLRVQGLLEDTLVLITSDESSSIGNGSIGDGIGGVTAGISSSADQDRTQMPPSNHGYLLALGAGLQPMEQPGLFGQVDVAISVLDALGLPPRGFHGASVFRRHAADRTLLAANTYKRTIYAIGEQALVRCDQMLNCM
ncbi:MAG: LTA synthase family protein [Thiohalocapsa sp.]